MTLPRAIAIDGPAASGKSTLAFSLAKKINYLYFDTGVMYRAVTWAALELEINPEDEKRVAELADMIDIDVQQPSIADGRSNDVLVGEKDVTWAIRESNIEEHVSVVSAYRGVRKALTSKQREVGSRGNVVMVGRDIGTVVLPDADLKFYIDASLEERAQRRYLEAISRGNSIDYKEILDSMTVRDKIDSTRDIAPLIPAQDAIIIQSDNFTAEEVLEKVMSIVLNYIKRKDNGES